MLYVRMKQLDKVLLSYIILKALQTHYCIDSPLSIAGMHRLEEQKDYSR